MHNIQLELSVMDLDMEVQILGINDIGFDSGNDLMCATGDLPWMQATVDDDIWAEWDAGFRDVIILDENNVEVDRFNVTANPLDDPDNYIALRELFISYATLD